MNPELAEALTRMDTALARLESATARHFDVDSRRSDLEVELGVMQDDRSRLSNELESTTARLGRLEAATDHVGRRVAAAIGTIQEVLDGARPADTAQDGRV